MHQKTSFQDSFLRRNNGNAGYVWSPPRAERRHRCNSYIRFHFTSCCGIQRGGLVLSWFMTSRRYGVVGWWNHPENASVKLGHHSSREKAGDELERVQRQAGRMIKELEDMTYVADWSSRRCIHEAGLPEGWLRHDKTWRTVNSQLREEEEGWGSRCV